MAVEENKAVVRREIEELFNHTGNLDAADEIIAPDYVSYEPTSGETRGIEGPSSSPPPTARPSPTLRTP
jgi:hypothetical protein